MENLKRIAKALGLELRKGGQGYVIYNRHYMQIHNEPTLESAAWYLSTIIGHKMKELQKYREKESA